MSEPLIEYTLHDDEIMMIDSLQESFEDPGEKIKYPFEFEQLQFELFPSGEALPSNFRVESQSKRYPNRPGNFINNHYSGIHVEKTFPDLQRQTKNELKKIVDNMIVTEDNLKVNFEYNIIDGEKEMTTIGYERAFSLQECGQPNIFTTTFEFDYLENSLGEIRSEEVKELSYKNFSVDGISDEIYQINDSQTNYSAHSQESQKFKTYTNVSNIESDFSLLGESCEKYFQDVHATQTYIHQFPNKGAISIPILGKIAKFMRVQEVFKKENIRKSNRGFGGSIEDYGTKSTSNQKKIDLEDVFRQLKSEWENDNRIENDIRKGQVSQTFAELDFEQILEQIQSRVEAAEAEQKAIAQQSNLESEIITELPCEAEEISSLISDKSVKDSLFNSLNLKDPSEPKKNKPRMEFDQEWAVEDNINVDNFHQMVPKQKMAQQYPFELDTFQKRSVYRMEQGENVFVCAHTSAGKTVVAEYSIALAKKVNRKAIYTSPIKALSNQKYRDFKEKFGEDVGIITGDVSLNPTANCLIVTTEILRNMLYQGHDIVRDIAWVIFDEVHYVNNSERGVIWEETIILLPETVGMVMLSATVPNYLDFANWVGRTKQRKVYVQKTSFRPVPLEHSIYLFNKLHVVKSGETPFQSSQYDALCQEIKKAIVQKGMISSMRTQQKSEKKQKGTFKNTNMSMHGKMRMKQINEKYIKNISEDDLNRQSGSSETQLLRNLILQCRNDDLLPCVVFTFSKKRIQELSENLGSLNLCDFEETKLIERFFNRAARKMKKSDLEVPQIQTIKGLLMRGIAVHHGDVIPFIKEVVELLFGNGLVKVLFATETFAMGINMPTKTVIFHSLRKYDSNGQRLLSSSEYTQMSGRAGRRGLDTKGNVIIFVTGPDNLPSKKDLVSVLDNRGELLESKFKISYETIINLINSNVLNVVDMMKRSYQENSKYSQLPVKIRKMKELRSEYLQLSKQTCIKEQPLGAAALPIESYFENASSMKMYSRLYFNQAKIDIATKMTFPAFCVLFDNKFRFFLGLILYIHPNEIYEPRFVYVMHVEQLESNEQTPVFEFQEDNFRTSVIENHYFYHEANQTKHTYKIYKLSLNEIVKIYDDPLSKITSNGMYDPNFIQQCVISLIQKQEQFKEHFLSETQAKKRLKRKIFKEREIKATEISRDSLNKNLDQYYNSPCHSCEIRNQHLSDSIRKLQIKNELTQIITSIDENKIAQQSAFEGKLRVLKDLGYVTRNDRMTMKARVEKEIQNIYVAELIFKSYFEDLDQAGIASLLSGFANQGKSKGKGFDPAKLFDASSPQFIELLNCYDSLTETTLRTIKSEIENGVVIASSAQEYMDEQVYNPDLLKVVFWWIHGANFSQICAMTDYQEGAIVRSFLRLENLLKNTRNCYVILGNHLMSSKLESCMELLRKDIVFSKSLYLDS